MNAVEEEEQNSCRYGTHISTSNVLRPDSKLWKLARMHGFAHAYWMTFADSSIALVFREHSNSLVQHVICGCRDISRPLTTRHDIVFKADGDDDPELFDNDKIFGLIAKIAEATNIVAGKHVIWPSGMSREEMEIKLDLEIGMNMMKFDQIAAMDRAMHTTSCVFQLRVVAVTTLMLCYVNWGSGYMQLTAVQILHGGMIQ